MLPHRKLLAVILAASLLASGCLPQVAQETNDLLVLQNELQKKFGDQTELHLAIGVNRGTLYVSFINSSANGWPEEARGKRAAEAAQFVKTRFRQIGQVRTILVSFRRRKTRLLVFHQTQTVGSYPFNENAQFIEPRNVTSSGVALETTASYSSRDNRSDVFAYGIQLEGEPGKDGVTVLPNFHTTGDVNVTKGPPPKTVQFDFASYSSTPRFKETESITFVTDGKRLLQTKGTFHGNDAQFCYLRLPYSVFRQMTGAKSLVIKLGDNEYPLTPRQWEVIRGMMTYVADDQSLLR